MLLVILMNSVSLRSRFIKNT